MGSGSGRAIAALEEVAVALNIREDYYQVESPIVLNETINTSELVSRYSGIPIPKNKAVVGGNALLTRVWGFTKMGSLKTLLPMKSSHLSGGV